MKILKFLGNCLGVLLILWDIGEFLIIPALFVVLGIFCELPAAYYWITIGGYLALFALFQLLLWWLEKKLGKHFDALLTHKAEKISHRFQPPAEK